MSQTEAYAQLTRQIDVPSAPTPWLEVDQDRIQSFADATGDQQWIHVDVERARRESPYRAPIAHGFLTLSLLPHLNAQVPQETLPGVKMGVNYGVNRVRFPAPVPAGSKVRMTSTLKAVEDRGDCLQLVREMVVEADTQKKPVCVAEMVARMYF